MLDDFWSLVEHGDGRLGGIDLPLYPRGDNEDLAGFACDFLFSFGLSVGPGGYVLRAGRMRRGNDREQAIDRGNDA